MSSTKTLQKCKNCGNEFYGNYCNNCGEKVYTEHDKSIVHFFEDAVHFITHLEGSFFTTLKTIFTRPGKYAYDFCDGQRKKYFKPLSLFMVLVVLYLLVPIYAGLNMPFTYFLFEKDYARKVVSKKTGVNMDSIVYTSYQAANDKGIKSESVAYEYMTKHADSVFNTHPEIKHLRDSYNHTSEKTSKVFLLLIVPLLAIPLYCISFYRRKFFFDHLVFSTELNSFFLILFFFVAPLVTSLLKLINRSILYRITDFQLGIALYILFGIYTSFAMRNFYTENRFIAILKAIFICYIHTLIMQQVYRYILFTSTLFLTH